jgi:hypothetical protein
MPNRFSRGKGLFGAVDVPASGLSIAGTAVSATAAELNRNAAAAMLSPVFSAIVPFVQTSAAGTYTGSITVPAGALILDTKLWSTVLWNAGTSATGKIGDVADDDGWFTGINMQATDLLVGEEINFVQTGGKEGAYLVLATGLRSAAYSASARVVSCIITTVGTGTAGRSFFAVLYIVPTLSTAATKV